MEVLINKLSKIFWIVLVLFCFLQIVTYQQFAVVVGCAVSLVTFWIFSSYIFNEKSIRTRPISFIAIVGVVMFAYFAPIMTFIEHHPITYNMISPITTFLWQLLYVLVTYVAYLYAGRKHKRNPIRKALIKIGYYEKLSNRSLWILGAIGLLGRIYLLKNQFGEEATSGAGTVYMLFIPFLMAPYCILFRPIFSGERPFNGNKLPFIIYSSFGFRFQAV